jgi:biopolymer transport protein ExbD
MSMNQSDSEEGINDINITPFVDVVLVLLVIFMVTAPMMIKEGMKVELPHSSTSDKMPSMTLSIVILKSGQVLLNGTLMTKEALTESSKTILKQSPEAKAIIGADLEAKHGDVISVMDHLKLAGIKNIAFQVVREAP